MSETKQQSFHHLREACRACDGGSLEPFLDLGEQPLANSFVRSTSDFPGELRFPLVVYRCTDCSLVQLRDVIAPEVLFRDYIYLTGTSETMVHHNRAYAKAVVEELKLNTEDLVVEIASNDGSLLACFDRLGMETLGVEPARNIAEMATKRGITTIAEFFDSNLARQMRNDYRPARAVVANNVVAHVDHPRDFLSGCRALLDTDGQVVTEFPYLGDLLEHLEYDTVYHEHLCYFSVIALMRLYQSAGLAIRKIDRVSVHGGSLRVYASQASETENRHGAAVQAMAECERQRGYDTGTPYRELASRVADNRRVLRELLQELRRSGNTVAGYGAPAKGNTLLNYCGIERDLVDYVVDRNPLKVGLFTPGTHIPVKDVNVLDLDPPDYLLVLAWNFADEIMRQQSSYAEQGGQFILPIPDPRIVAS